MTKKTKTKKLSLRQRLRIQSSIDLDVMQAAVHIAVRDVVASHSKISPIDVMRLIAGGQVKSLEKRLITELANETEAKLEAIYNKQMNLLPEDHDGNVKEA